MQPCGQPFYPKHFFFLWTVYYKDSLLYMIASDRMACEKKPHNTLKLEKKQKKTKQIL